MAQPIDRFTPARLATSALAVACLALTLGTAACSSTNASAQGGGTTSQADSSAPSPGAAGARGGNRRMAKVLASLGLSDDQKTQIRKIMSDARTQARTETDPDARRATMRTAFQKLQDVLTPAQRDAFKAKMQAMRNQNGGQAAPSTGQGAQQ